MRTAYGKNNFLTHDVLRVINMIFLLANEYNMVTYTKFSHDCIVLNMLNLSNKKLRKVIVVIQQYFDLLVTHHYWNFQ